MNDNSSKTKTKSKRYFLYLSYKGTAYHGWQKQPNANSVQQEVEDKLGIILQDKTEIVASGRTDTGVHATEQVAHLDLPEQMDITELVYKLNKVLPHDVAARKICPVIHDAHARFDAVSRSYEYHITKNKNPFLHELAYHSNLSLNLDKMNEAAGMLLKHKDYESFSKVKTDVHTFNCDIFEAVWKEENENLVFHVSANRFLRGMVRALVGTLMDVGQGRCGIAGFEQIITAKNRQKAGRAVPPQGLYLTSVHYPESIFQH